MSEINHNSPVDISLWSLC